MFKAVIESWCYLNCIGKWDAAIVYPIVDGHKMAAVHLDLYADDDAVLFMLSPEYGYMGSPPLKSLTN